jgi:hypothetical protein
MDDEDVDQDEYMYAERSSGLPPPPRFDPRLDTKGPVYCHKCGKNQVIDTLVCLKEDSWPMCCGQLMDPETMYEKKHPLPTYRKKSTHKERRNA